MSCDLESESAFSTGGHVLDDYQSQLNKDTAEALLCSQDWMKEMYPWAPGGLPMGHPHSPPASSTSGAPLDSPCPPHCGHGLGSDIKISCFYPARPAQLSRG
ncbi:hypothetical protein PGTUg99_021963 [Puccinia graminis f. sp. tritici]|uniref:HAT C-terminal dimerisation domain-containing protein n=1 Tax=Puccinia graminis f. sp. tritici TaxID=56615 RepID=A0A5B0M3Z7_PUCGR|nr:hypothetical protein PGTUg99_021963 [Puccinia graminis f. sp. tritici]